MAAKRPGRAISVKNCAASSGAGACVCVRVRVCGWARVQVATRYDDGKVNPDADDGRQHSRLNKHLQHHHQRPQQEEEGVDQHRKHLRQNLPRHRKGHVDKGRPERDDQHTQVEDGVVERARVKGRRHKVVVALHPELGEPARGGDAKDVGVAEVAEAVDGGIAAQGRQVGQHASRSGRVGARGVGVALGLFGRLEPRRVGGGTPAPLARLEIFRAVEPIVRKVGLAEEPLPVLVREREREDLEREHNRRLHHVKGGGVPHGQDARVDDVDARIVKDARRVPRDFGNLKEQRALVKGLFGIAVHPQEDLMNDEKHQQNGQDLQRLLAQPRGRVHARLDNLKGAHRQLPDAIGKPGGRLRAVGRGLGHLRNLFELRFRKSGSLGRHGGSACTVAPLPYQCSHRALVN